MTAERLRALADHADNGVLKPGVGAALRVLADIADWATRNAHQGGWREAGKEVLALIQQAKGQP